MLQFEDKNNKQTKSKYRSTCTIQQFIKYLHEKCSSEP